MGKDNSGNKYYQNSKGKRWVIYNGEINASKIESDWYQWMHYQINSDPLKTKVSKYSWQKPHSDNKTGTKEAYRPNKITNKKKDFNLERSSSSMGRRFAGFPWSRWGINFSSSATLAAASLS